VAEVIVEEELEEAEEEPESSEPADSAEAGELEPAAAAETTNDDA
jgi:hypothetical protein